MPEGVALDSDARCGMNTLKGVEDCLQAGRIGQHSDKESGRTCALHRVPGVLLSRIAESRHPRTGGTSV